MTKDIYLYLIDNCYDEKHELHSFPFELVVDGKKYNCLIYTEQAVVTDKFYDVKGNEIPPIVKYAFIIRSTKFIEDEINFDNKRFYYAGKVGRYMRERYFQYISYELYERRDFE